MSRDLILLFPSTPFFTASFRSLPRYDSSRSRAIAYSAPCVAKRQRVLRVYKLLHSSLYRINRFLSYKVIAAANRFTRAPIAVPTRTSERNIRRIHRRHFLYRIKEYNQLLQSKLSFLEQRKSDSSTLFILVEPNLSVEL